MGTKGRRTGTIGSTMAGVLACVDQQIFRTLPPAAELVRHARADDPIPSGDGKLLVIGGLEPADICDEEVPAEQQDGTG
jgi:hypothetical protein